MCHEEVSALLHIVYLFFVRMIVVLAQRSRTGNYDYGTYIAKHVCIQVFVHMCVALCIHIHLHYILK